MPYLIRDANDVHIYRPADQSERGAFEVSQSLAAVWGWECRNGHRPTRNGLPLRPFPAGIYHGEPVPEGVFVDWQDDVTREFIFRLRETELIDQDTHGTLAERFGFQHPLQPYRAAHAWARRIRVTGARGGAPRQSRDFRRWSNRAWSTSALQATSTSAFRRFGIEIEFNHDGYDLSATRNGIVRDARAAGINGTQRWGSHYRDTSIAGWQYMYDCTVTGGEIVSDILDGSAAAHDEVRAMLAAVRDNGGNVGHSGTGTGAAAEQGMHVHHDCSDYNRADKLRLIDNLEAAQDAILAFPASSRTRNNRWCKRMGSYEFAPARSAITAGRGAHMDRYYVFNLNHLMLTGGQARIEWRALGNTLNGRKVRAWIRLGQAFMQATKTGESFASGITTLELVTILRQHGLTQWAADQVLARTLVTV